MKEFSIRYYLFMVPVFGAGLGIVATLLWRAADRRYARLLLGVVGAGLVLIGLRDTIHRVHDNLHATDAELAEAVAAVDAADPPCEGMFARKPHVPYYADCTDLSFPPFETLDELHEWIRTKGPDSSFYLYYGSAERQYRPRLGMRAAPGDAPPWLQPVASGRAAGGWVLYRYLGSPDETGVDGT